MVYWQWAANMLVIMSIVSPSSLHDPKKPYETQSYETQSYETQSYD